MRSFFLLLVCVAFCAVKASRSHHRHARSTRRTHVGRVLLRMADLRGNNIEPSAMHRLWDNFKQRYQKEYESIEEEVKRVKIYFENMWFIETHNQEHQQGKHNFSLRLNEWGDMEHEEFVSTMNGFKQSYGDSMAKGHAVTYLEPHNLDAPKSVDWRKHGYVTPVKNQGQCGSCWSFSATGALEGQHFRKTGKLVALSEQNLVDCSTTYGNNGCEGGLMDQAFQYIKDNDGIDTEMTYPYEGQDLRCRFNRTDVGADDTGFVDVTRGSEKALKSALASVGPISVAIDAAHRSFQFYSQGVYNEPECSSERLDHGVLTVGYGTTDEGQDYWIIKNSWGPSWGDQGFIKMARNQENMCGVATQASYPLV